ncbi:hypothetical protein MFIFM68171_04991 [Madurella fahalii]|uniref:Uncharacterized protein n=1 Tax=Madurella fahalii TaxID=1157608 RepID=A0ABQ0GAM4_9PEZI
MIDSTTLLHRTIACPTHHKKHMERLQEMWDLEWANIAMAKTDPYHRQRAQQSKEEETLSREKTLGKLYREADLLNAEFYSAAVTFQLDILVRVSQSSGIVLRRTTSERCPRGVSESIVEDRSVTRKDQC